ncbi:unnamed protein product [Diabrotica balteata]|uniref:Prominin-like protein n=1 Tax=Diabrotica balteata TaxID=107213 RepID=A0A9N9SLN8_DIABA|nr:unnamed protein product [Diabrotica balteata]
MATDMRGFENLRAQMPEYTNYTDTNNYTAASITFSPGGLKGLYDMTKSFVDSLLPPNFLTEDLISWDHSGSPSLNTGYADLVKQYAGLITFFVIIVLLCLLIPISGLIFACLRCCGLCGAKARVSKKKKDLCLKIILGIFLIVCCGVLLFGIASAFATTHGIKVGVNQLRDNGKKVYSDSVGYMDDIKDHVHLLLENNYKEFSESFTNTLDGSGREILENLPLWNDIMVITNISTFCDKLTDLQAELQSFQKQTTELKTEGQTLIDNMNSIKKDLTETLQNCGSDCAAANDLVNGLNIKIDVQNIPEIPDIFENVPIKNIKSAADTVNKLVQEVPDKINSQIQTIKDKANTEINTAGNTIKNNTKVMDDLVVTVKKQMLSVYSSFEDGNDYLEKYYPYFYYVGIVISCVLLLVLVFLFFGLVFGLFGNRPDKYKSYCCSKGTGSVFLITAVVLIFIITVVICIMALVMSVGGLAADRIICYSLRNPDKSTIINVIDKYIQENIKDTQEFSFNITNILNKCYQNQSIYQVLNLKSKFDIDETISQFDINATITEIVNKVGNKIDEITDFNFLDSTTKAELEKLTNVNINILLNDFKSLQDMFNQTIIDVDLDNLVKTLNTMADTLKNEKPELATTITEQAQEVENYNKKQLKPFIEKVNTILATTDKLQNDLKMDSMNFPEAIKTFINQVEKAQENFKDNKEKTTEIFKKAASQFGKLMVDQISGYTDRIASAVNDELGMCGPLNVAIHGALTAFCDKITLPWNGFWASLFVCLVTFVPIIIISIWLASIYKSYKADDQHLIRDPKHRGKKNKRDNFNDYYNIPPRNNENPLGKGHNDGNHNYYQASAPNDNRNSRYYDMAPKFNRQHEASTRF